MLRIDTAVALLVALVTLCGYLPLAPYLGLFPRILLPAALLFGYFFRRRGYRLPNWLVTVCGLLFFLFYALQVSRTNLVGPAADLLILFLALRLFGEQSGRHYLQIYVLAVFCLSASSLFSLDSMFLVYLLVMLPALAVSLVLLSFVAVDPDAALSRSAMGKVLRTAILIPVGAVPLALVFFVILPRTQYAMWNFLNQQEGAVVGFSDRVQPGSASSQSEVKTLVFRAETGRLPDDRLYWRGIVLNRFTGTAWERTAPAGNGLPVGGTDRPVTVVFYPEPTKSRYLITLDQPLQLSGIRSDRTGDAVYLQSYGRAVRTRYEVTALPGARLEERAGARMESYLQLPPGYSPAIRRLARETAAGARSGREVIDRFERFYRSNGFRYATSGLPTDAHPLDTFLFKRRQGNCEFFASSLAVLLRSAGVPARLVGGYQGGDYNELGGFYAVTEDRAHVWVEADPDGEGWVTIDPSRWAVNADERVSRPGPGLYARIRQAADAVEYYWTRTVIAYDLEKQIEMVRSAGRRWSGVRLRVPDMQNMAMVVVSLLAAAGAFALRGRRRLSREERLLRLLYVRLRREGRLPADHAGMGLFRLAERLGDPVVHRFAERYGAAVYHDRPLSSDEYKGLRQLIRQIGNGASGDAGRNVRSRPDDA